MDYVKSLVSIVMPLYNSAPYIHDAVNSIITQSYKAWELIIIDDCSSDNSFKIANQLARTYSHLTIIVTQTPKNSGTAFARNMGLAISRGQYISFLDSDDYVHHNYLENQIQFISKHGPIVTSSYLRQAKNITTYKVPKRITYSRLLYGNPISCLSTLYDQSVTGRLRFCEDMKKNEDWLFWLNLLKKGYIAYGNPKILATYRILSNSKSRNKSSLIKYTWNIYRRQIGLNLIDSIWHLFWWILYGLKKNINIKIERKHKHYEGRNIGSNY